MSEIIFLTVSNTFPDHQILTQHTALKPLPRNERKKCLSFQTDLRQNLIFFLWSKILGALHAIFLCWILLVIWNIIYKKLFAVFSAFSLGKDSNCSHFVCPAFTASSLSGDWRIMTIYGLIESFWAKDLNYGEIFFGFEPHIINIEDNGSKFHLFPLQFLVRAVAMG
jgi:hypothetical protein